MQDAMPSTDRPAQSTAARIAINFGPLLLFFAASKAGKSLFERGMLTGLKDAEVASAVIGTGVFMVATLLAALWHWSRERHLPPAMIFTAVIVILFGGLTVWLQDKAFIQLKPGESATVEEIEAFCKENMTGYKRPRQIEFRDALPMSNVGKVLRRLLRNEESAKGGAGGRTA
jgi:acyl-CoA synthetase (AMP-forming)/AMP-acid ligase II